MANEITSVCSLLASNGGASVNSVGATRPASKSFNMTNTDMGSWTQALTAGATTLLAVPAGVTGAFRLHVINLTSTNYIDFSYDNANAQKFSQLEALDHQLFHPADKTKVYATANTVDARIACVAVEK